MDVHEPFDMDAQDDANARADRVEAKPTARHRLLIVEDEAVIRFVLRCEFEQRGFAVTEVEDGAGALETFRREPHAWTGVFVDLLLPDTHGDALIERLQALRPDLPAVLMTGDCDPETERRARERAVTVLRKPFPLERVRPLIAAMLRHAQTSAQEQPA
jgi:two-component system, OmpR family, phosphate regulon response regulator OmpR